MNITEFKDKLRTDETLQRELYDLIEDKDIDFYNEIKENHIVENYLKTQQYNKNDSLGFCFSIGGTALEVGSIKVSTINLARISYETSTKEEYLKQLKNEVILDCKLLDRIRHIIKRNIEKGLLPNYTHGLMHLENQYNTIGIIGIYETLQKFGLTKKDTLGNTYYTDDGVEFAKNILKAIDDAKEEFRKEYNCDYMINLEQIPGERAAAVLMEKDQQLYPNETYELPLYGNQRIPLGVKCSLDEKIKLSAILDDACGGGCAIMSHPINY